MFFIQFHTPVSDFISVIQMNLQPVLEAKFLNGILAEEICEAMCLGKDVVTE